MQSFRTLGLIGIFVFLGGCAPHYPTNDDLLDLYLSTLDDKHFVWCELDLEQCRHDFEKWNLTPRSRMIIREFEQENTGQTYNTRHLPNVFRTRFVDKNQFAEETGGTKPHGISTAPGIYGPPLAPDRLVEPSRLN